MITLLHPAHDLPVTTTQVRGGRLFAGRLKKERGGRRKHWREAEGSMACKLKNNTKEKIKTK
jgi:hypothetical protein